MISAVVIAKNEESRIRTCLESIRWVDEIIVLDNGSTDKTKQIAKEYTSRIIELNDLDFSSVRNRGTRETKGDWIIYIDSDERVLKPLQNEIAEVIASGMFSAYAISRRNIILGKEVNYGPYRKDWVIRLFKKADLEEWVGKVHEYPRFRGKLGYSKNSLLHLTHRDIDQIVLKSLEWSKIDAKLRLEAGHPQMSGWRFLRILFSELFNQGFKREGFFNGTVGIIDSILQTFSMFITYVRLWQIQQSETLEKTYDEIDNQLIKNKFQ